MDLDQRGFEFAVERNRCSAGRILIIDGRSDLDHSGSCHRRRGFQRTRGPGLEVDIVTSAKVNRSARRDRHAWHDRNVVASCGLLGRGKREIAARNDVRTDDQRAESRKDGVAGNIHARIAASGHAHRQEPRVADIAASSRRFSLDVVDLRDDRFCNSTDVAGCKQEYGSRQDVELTQIC